MSIKDETGEFSPFSSPTQNAFDLAAKYIPMGTYEVTSDVAAVGASFLTSSVIATLTGPAAFVTGPLSFGYSLYAYNKAGERGRQYIQEALGLNGADSKEFGTFIE